jgi:hypothetical protein
MALGIRYPVKMLPIMLFEFIWKCLWIVAIYLPLAQANRITSQTRESLIEIALGVIVCGLAIPWPYVVRNYLFAATEQSRKRKSR